MALAGELPPNTSTLPLDEKYDLVRSVGEECIAETELRNLLEKKPGIRCYDGFEPSGRMHIAQGIFKAVNVNKCTVSGCTFVFWVADWFALMNDKMGGDIDKIKIVGEYLIEVWKAAGMDMQNVEFRWSSDDINAHAKVYWTRVLDIARRNTLARIKKCCQIMGRTEGTLTAAQILYPLMQCGDIFHLRADICQLGLDQRKVNMLAREYCDQVGRKLKPVILGHHMLAGLLPGMAKMSKSNPDSAIFMEDSAEDVARKIGAAYCPKVAQAASGEVTEDGAVIGSDDTNPCLDYIKSIIFARPGASFTAAETTYGTYAEVEAAFVAGSLEEAALKAALTDALNALLQPVRDHFANDERAKNILEQVKSFRSGGAAPAVTQTAVPKPTTPVMVAWLPTALHHPLRTLVGIVNELNDFVATEGNAAVLLLPDWSAFANNDVGGEEKDIAAALEYAAGLCKAYGLDEKVRVVKQGEVILADPNSYWLNVIAAGRRNALDDVEAAASAHTAGQIVSTLMRAADVVALKATHLASVNGDHARNVLAAAFVGDGAVTAVAAAAPAFAATLCDPKAAPTTVDDHLYADETELDLRRKAKRAYAAPNESGNTMVEIGHYVIAKKGALSVKRKEEQGGDVVYDSAAQLSADADSGALHPGDLKAAVVPELMELTKPAREAMAKPDMKKLATALKNAEKKASKKASKQ